MCKHPTMLNLKTFQAFEKQNMIIQREKNTLEIFSLCYYMYKTFQKKFDFKRLYFQFYMGETNTNDMKTDFRYLLLNVFFQDYLLEKESRQGTTKT